MLVYYCVKIKTPDPVSQHNQIIQQAGGRALRMVISGMVSMAAGSRENGEVRIIGL